ncbi:MAG: MOSC domain-containing protein [Proteobacteria bacterium]|nr:MOSC domain-containing protein [Pseudomonadota bacterium]
MPDVRITALNVHPLKGARPIAVARADVAPEGLATGGVGDREWMVVDASGRFVTQRSHPRLALVGTAAADGVLTLTHGTSSLRLPPADATPSREVTVWRSHVRGFDAGDVAAAWIGAALDSDGLRIVRFDPAKPRRCNPDFVGDSGAHTRFADGYPILVIGEASLAELNGRLAARGHAPVPMDRFRPNVVVSELEAYGEDYVETLTLGSVVLRLVKPCTRCEVTTIDQASGARGDEPLSTLAGYRHHPRLRGLTFGVNAIVVRGAGSTLAVGADGVADFAF